MLPQPSVSFTLPSVHDGTELDCRLFHPSTGPSHPGLPWSGHAAVVAPPYAPLGGCYNDAIVDVVAGTLLQVGYLVVTFNFRGAASSAGRTSWTSKPEQADYVSVIGFLAYYVHHLDRLSSNAHEMDPRPLPTLLMAGYSYGAIVAMNLPHLDTILAHFATPAIHTAEADIRLRAEHLAEAHNSLPASPGSPQRSLGVRLGGDEVISERNHDGHGPVSDSHREERIRESVGHLLSRAKLVHRPYRRWPSSQEAAADDGDEMHQCLDEVPGGIRFQSAYLAVSPPVGIMARLITFSLFNHLSLPWARRPRAVAADDTPLASNPTLVIYGGQDGFISYSKMREWTYQLSSASGSQFHHVEVTEAGHFWAEGDTIYELRDVVGAFATELADYHAESNSTPQGT
ncbi:Alpha/Beta hydrolase protein [Xylaria bambusicola]|uniref:Alpha/Beta hydrolase protein n=1 Tax=Xylaria bambusicola TaxID=326684 RepID=UPI002007CB76|nr:Alpha/Beta hydrolase protein [Xylaria bambusicola]KAI0517090.1 Alpha/Beta hydrolase protein [Xylaria bambusicola]